jgi:hypothetical protein
MNVQEVIDKINKEKRQDNYFVMDNLFVDYTNMKKLAKEDVIKLRKGSNTNLNTLMENYYNYCSVLVDMGIPFDTIDIRGTSGLVLTQSIYQKLMTDQNFINFLSMKDYKKCYKAEKEWKPIDAIEWLKNIKITDTIDLIPVKFTFNPWRSIKETTKLLNPLHFLNKEAIHAYDCEMIIPFEELKKFFEETGNIVRFHYDATNQSKSLILKSYEDYFKSLVDVDEKYIKDNTRYYLNIRTDFNTNNVK